MNRPGSALKGRIGPMALAIVLALPVTLAQPREAKAACSIVWGGSTTVFRSMSPASGFTYTSSVTYRLGYDTCRLDVPAQIKVESFRNTMKITGSSATAIHTDAGAAVLEWFNNSVYDYKVAWSNPAEVKHTGNGTWTRSETPNKVMTYYSSVAIRQTWRGCSWSGVGQCRMWYQFRRGTIAWEWT